MQVYDSKVKIGQTVTFPEWKGERHYMIPFTVGRGLAGELGRFQTTVNQMMDGVLIDRDQECYLMVDEKQVTPGNFHRRPGLHVDGYWDPGTKGHGGHIACHGGGNGGHVIVPRHRSGNGGHVVFPQHNGGSGHCGSRNDCEGLLLASNYAAARAVVGEYSRDFVNDWRGGDCSDLSVSGLQDMFLQANRAYHLDVMTLHESLPITENVRRMVVRINVPNWKN